MQVNPIAPEAPQDILAGLYGQVTSGREALLAYIQRALGCDRVALAENLPNEDLSPALAFQPSDALPLAAQTSPLISMDGLVVLPIEAPDSANTYLVLEYADSLLATERLSSPAILHILPHISQAMTMSVRIERQDAEIHSALYVLQHHPIPIVIIDDKWREVFSNRAVGELLDHTSPASVNERAAGHFNSRPSLAAAMDRDAKQRVNKLLGGESDESVLLPMSLGPTALRMLVTPAKATGLFGDLSRDRLVWIYLLGSPLFNRLETNVRFRQLGLSAAESELVTLLVQGDRTLNDIAQLRGVSSQTVKKQLRSVFRKTHCDSQESLMCFLFEHIVQYNLGGARI